MIKGKSPFPFDTIALALAFSPRLEALLTETRRFQLLYKCRVVLIHVGKKTSEKQRNLAEILNRLGFSDADTRIHWEQGNLVDSITAVCKQEVVDLLIMGALQKENILAYYMGTVSRDISRRAKCSVLLLTDPAANRRIQRIMVNGHDHPKTPFTLKTALYVADNEKVEKVWVISEVDIPVLTMGMAEDASSAEVKTLQDQLVQEEQDRFERLNRQHSLDKNRFSFVSVSGRSGHSLAQFARTQQADLLVVNSPDHSLSIFDRIFTHDIEYLLSDLPCNLLIVHSRLQEPTFDDGSDS